jgi:hypothetical protein
MAYLRDEDARDAELVKNAQAGVRGELEEPVRRHQPWVLHVAHRMLWNPERDRDRQTLATFYGAPNVCSDRRQ